MTIGAIGIGLVIAAGIIAAGLATSFCNQKIGEIRAGKRISRQYRRDPLSVELELTRGAIADLKAEYGADIFQ